MNYYDKRDELRRRAKSMTDWCRTNYQHEINDRVSRTKTYELLGKDVIPDLNKEYSLTEQILVRSDSVSRIHQVAKSDSERVGVLNFASYTHPGGQFLNGSSAQEECLCHSSYLFNILREQSKYYYWNRRHLNNKLYLHRALYSPEVRFFGDAVPHMCDVITCAAPNLRNKLELDNKYKETLIKRIQLIKWITEDNDIEVLLLGAWGCGVFQNDPRIIATCFRDVFNQSSIKRVEYVIPDDINYYQFKKVL